eukprot:m51a1_g34 hypothetical protein (370) ;mRNA; r:131852-133407
MESTEQPKPLSIVDLLEKQRATAGEPPLTTAACRVCAPGIVSIGEYLARAPATAEPKELFYYTPTAASPQPPAPAAAPEEPQQPEAAPDAPAPVNISEWMAKMPAPEVPLPPPVRISEWMAKMPAVAEEKELFYYEPLYPAKAAESVQQQQQQEALQAQSAPAQAVECLTIDEILRKAGKTLGSSYWVPEGAHFARIEDFMAKEQAEAAVAPEKQAEAQEQAQAEAAAVPEKQAEAEAAVAPAKPAGEAAVTPEKPAAVAVAPAVVEQQKLQQAENANRHEEAQEPEQSPAQAEKQEPEQAPAQEEEQEAEQVERRRLVKPLDPRPKAAVAAAGTPQSTSHAEASEGTPLIGKSKGSRPEEEGCCCCVL